MIEIRVLLGKLLGEEAPEEVKKREPSICVNCQYAPVTNRHGSWPWPCHIPDVDGTRMDYVTGEEILNVRACTARNKDGNCEHFQQVSPTPLP